MADRIVKVLETGKLILRGLKGRGRAAVLNMDDDETLNLTINWSDWLGSDTISSVTNEVTAVNSTHSGWIQHRITTAGGLTKELLILVEVAGFPVMDDYGLAYRLTA